MHTYHTIHIILNICTRWPFFTIAIWSSPKSWGRVVDFASKSQPRPRLTLSRCPAVLSPLRSSAYDKRKYGPHMSLNEWNADSGDVWYAICTCIHVTVRAWQLVTMYVYFVAFGKRSKNCNPSCVRFRIFHFRVIFSAFTTFRLAIVR